jgi:hypothetical protein
MTSSNPYEMRTIAVTRYVTPLREGGSLPAIAEGDDGFLYVLKFRGAGQGTKALIAELIGGMIAKLLELKVPELVYANIDEAFGRTEPDEEIQDLLKASVGLNIGVHYLSGSITYDPNVIQPDPQTASRIVWMDAFLTNVDRTCRNTNMLMWYKDLWVIDHGACLYFHHSWDDWEAQSLKPFAAIKDHVLLPFASELEAADQWARKMINKSVLDAIVELIPDTWLVTDYQLSFDEQRTVYKTFLWNRFTHSSIFLNQAIDARKALI